MLTKKEVFRHYIKCLPEEHSETIKQLFIIADNHNLGFITPYEANSKAIEYIDHYVNKTTIFDLFSYIERDIFANIFYEIFMLFEDADEIHYDSDNQDYVLEQLYKKIRNYL